MTRSGHAEDTRYFVEYGVHTRSGLPPLYRSRTLDEGRRDELWNVERRDWVETRQLVPYRFGGGDHDLQEISADQAEAMRAQQQSRFDGGPNGA